MEEFTFEGFVFESYVEYSVCQILLVAWASPPPLSLTHHQ